MQIKITKKIGNSVIEFKSDKEKMKDAMLELDAFMKKDACSCGSEDIIFDTRKVNAKDGSGSYVYVKRKCLKCGKESTLGELKDGSGYFWKEWEEWKILAQTDQTKKDAISPDDIPF